MRWHLLRALSIAAVWLAASQARAHIRLLQPPPWIQEDEQGDPQKVGPCGTSGGTPSDVVTTYRPGETITVSWVETIYHPGHFRIALARDRDEFTDPEVTASGGISVSAEIADPPVYPVLLDGLYPRTGNGTSGRSFSQEVTLPDTPCERCTLQVIQFMAQHGVPFLYYHCADISIVAGGPAADAGADAGTGGARDAGDAGRRDGAVDAASPPSDDAAMNAGRDAGDEELEADGCALASSHARGGELSLLLLGLLARRRRLSARR